MANISQEELIAAMQSGGGASAGLIQVMQARLDSLVGRPSGLIETLPKPVQKRIKYLKVLQEEFDDREEEYEKELDELDKKYAAIYAPIFAKRAAIVKGDAEAPADTVLDSTEGADTGPAGIPEFWLGVLRANEFTASQLTEKDEGILEYLVDISSEELTAEDECGFKLTFDFADNPYFENKVLTKTYHMVDSDEPVLERAIGTKIDWKAGKNVTIKVLKKKPKQGRGGKSNARPITKTEAVDSFFSFFSPPKVPEEGDDDLDEEEIDQLQAALEEDYEIGETIRDQLIPNAVSWYTGEAEENEEEDDEDDDEDGEDDEDEEEDDDNDDDNDDDDEDDGEQEDRGTRAKGKQNVKLPTDAKEQPPECKQQ